MAPIESAVGRDLEGCGLGVEICKEALNKVKLEEKSSSGAFTPQHEGASP